MVPSIQGMRQRGQPEPDQPRKLSAPQGLSCASVSPAYSQPIRANDLALPTA